MAEFEKRNPDRDNLKKIKADTEKEYLRELKKKDDDFLVNNLSIVERESIAQWIVDRFDEVKGKHTEIEDRIDEYDEIYRMQRKEIIGSDGTLPNYRSPMTTVAMEVVHAKVMNVFFTPVDIAQVLPTEEGDIPKVRKLSTFMNWSARNELKMFESMDRLFHNSEKTGESPYLVHWVKEYGIKIEKKPIPDPTNPTENLVDPDTKETLFQEIEEEQLLYNAPRLEPFSRKDYFQPKNALMDKIPDWEMMRIRMTYDQYLREELQGKMYGGSIKDITDWGTGSSDTNKIDYEGDQIEVGKWEKEFIVFYGRLRVNVVKSDAEDELEDTQELEDEFIAIVNIEDQVLCQLRKNRFPLKMRPIGVDYFMPDDDGRRRGIGMVEFMENIQKGYDVLYNQFIFGTEQSNNPFGFYSPTGNQRDEPLKIKNGYLYPSSDPGSVNIVKLPPPDKSLSVMMELLNQWAQLLFGISDFAAGTESKIDKDAPARKVAIIVDQGNVRMNNIIKRKNKTIEDILRRWFLLYQANMPPNKYMRIVGESQDDPWKFENINLEDFALKSIPDFHLTGNVLNSNKALEANKRIAVYQLMVENPLYQPVSAQGIQALHSLTKWLIEGLDETGLSTFLPDPPGENVQTPQEENARFLQGDQGEPEEGEDHVGHNKVHNEMLVDPTVPDEIKEIVAKHMQKHIELLRAQITQQIVLQQSGIPAAQAQQQLQGGGQQSGQQLQQGGQPQGGLNAQSTGARPGAGQQVAGVV